MFDDISKEDLVLAFFPCTRFETKIELHFRGEAYQQKNKTDMEKLEISMKLHEELHEYYMLISQLCVIALRKGFKLVIENPKSTPHYLNRYWCLKPKIIDTDRTLSGDYYKKPTQYWFVNFEPYQNIVFEPIEYVETSTIDKEIKMDGIGRKTARSMIHPQYANRFIRQYLIEGQE